MKPHHLILVLFLVAFGAALAQPAEERPRNRFEHDILTETFGFDDSTPRTVEVEALYQGCPARDCIPSIDEPRYVDAEAAEVWLESDDLVLAMVHDGIARAWPIHILDRHEIVNDTIAGDPVAITWCPLCGSGVAFDRRLDGEVVEFGVSGVLHDSDLVMYDRKSDTLWQQITGEGIMGPKTGEQLTTVPVSIVEWGRWVESHPATEVLSRETGFDIDYSGNRPYAAYEASDRLAFPASNRDLSIHPKKVVYGFEFDDESLAVFDDTLDEHGGEIETRVGEQEVTINRNSDGQVVAVLADGSRRIGTRLFWFAWYNFHPHTARL